MLAHCVLGSVRDLIQRNTMWGTIKTLGIYPWLPYTYALILPAHINGRHTINRRHIQQ